jgi:hypothetical protein
VTDVVSVIEYRLVRPDGTLLWTCAATNYVGAPAPPTSLRTAAGGDWVDPPWRFEAREEAGEWTLLASDPQVGGQ